MHHFSYRHGVLHAEDVDLRKIVESVGTPFYCYSTATLERHYRVFSAALTGMPNMICYAMKANSNQAVLRTLAGLGAGMDVVSEGELRRARQAGVPASKLPSPVLASAPAKSHMASTRTYSVSMPNLNPNY